MEENNKKKNKTKVVVISCIIVAVLLGIGGAHVYASTHGYGNVFFLIKYLVTGEKPEITDKNELLSDRDITLSYEPINLTENIKIQIRNIQIKDNKAKLLIGVNEKEKNNTSPLKYKVYNESDKLICDYEGKTQEDKPSEYIEELILNEFKNNDKIIKLEIYNAKNEKLTRIIINLETREITIEGEEEAVNKISEIELKRFLESISALEKYKNSDDERILFAQLEIELNENLKVSGGLFDEVNKMLEATGYEKLSNPLKNADYFKITNKNGINYIEVTYGREGFEPNKVIEIKNISYCGGIYAVNFTYTFIHPSDEFNTNIDDLDIEEATAYIKLNEDKTYSTFKVVKYEKVKDSITYIENNELIGSWKPIFAEENGKEISLMNIYGSAGATGEMTFDSNGKYTAFIGTYSSESEDNLKGDYINGGSSVTLIANSGKKEILTIKKIHGLKYLEKKIEHTTVYFGKKGLGYEEKETSNITENQTDIMNNLENSNIEMTEYEKAIRKIKSTLLDKSWLQENASIKPFNGIPEEQEYKFAVIKGQDSSIPIVVLVVSPPNSIITETFIIRYKNGEVNAEKVFAGHKEYRKVFTNGKYFATTHERMNNNWEYELKEVTVDEIRTIDRNGGKVEKEDYDYIEVANFIKNNNLKEVDTELNETNLNSLLK